MQTRTEESVPALTKLPGIQSLRGIAALAVVLHHVLEESSPLRSTTPAAPIVLCGASGVDIFFVISGFIMLSTTLAKFGQPKAGIHFLARRLTRIAPLYWLCLLTILAAHASGILYRHISVSPSSVIGSFLFIATGHMILGVGWTLNYEMWFYLVFAFFLFARSAQTAVCLIVGTLLATLSLAKFSPSTPILRFLANPISLEFCYGLAIALIYTRIAAVKNTIRQASFAAGLIGIALASTYAPHRTTAGLDDNWRFLAWGLPASLLVLSLIDCRNPKTAPGKVLLLIGDASYSLYLTHPIVMTIYARIIKTGHLHGQNVYLVMATVILASVFVGLATHRLVERPIEALAKRIKTQSRLAKEAGRAATQAAA